MHGPAHLRSASSSFVAACAPAQSRRGARARAIEGAVVVVLGLVLAPLCGAQDIEPFRIRNLNPLVSIFGLPAWDLVTPGNRFDATVEVANHYRLSARGDETLALDGETVRTNLAFSHGFGERWSIGAEIPYFRVGGGVLDDLIDGWHSTFGLPDGGRNARREGDLWFMLADADGTFYELDEPRNGWGDLQLKAARTLGKRGGFTLQGGVKVPTGDERMLAGSGSADWSLTLLRAQAVSGRARPAGYYWGVGVVHAGEPELIDYPAEEWVYTAIVGGTWQPWRKFGLKAQLDVSSPFFDSPLEEIGESAIQATLGAWWTATQRARLEFALVEDLEVSTAPDLVLHVAAHWRWE